MKMKLIISNCLYVVLFMGLFVVRLNAQNTFVRFYNGIPTGGIPYCVESTTDGGYLIGGYNGQLDSFNVINMQVRKVDANGNEIWKREDNVRGWDMVHDIVINEDHTFYEACELGFKPGLCKRDTDGTLRWAKVYTTNDTSGTFFSIIKATDGNLVMVGGITPDSIPDINILVQKTDTEGNIIWRRIIPQTMSGAASSIIETFDSSYLITGYTQNDYPNIYNATTQQFFLLKIEGDGTIDYYKTYGDTAKGADAQSIAQSPNGDILIAGSFTDITPNSNEAAFYTLDDTGKLIHTYFDTIDHQNFFTTCKIHNGDLYLLERVGKNQNNDSSTDIKVIKYALSTNTIVFENLFQIIGVQGPADMLVNNDGSIIIAFTQSDTGACYVCTGLAKLDSSGCVTDWCYTGVSIIEGEPTVTVFPNPFNNELMIEPEDVPKGTIIELYNLTGALVKPPISVTGTDKTEIDTKELPNGFYLLNVQYKTFRKVYKLIKMHN